VVLAPDWQPVAWNEAKRGSGTYWGGALPDSFIQYATPDINSAEPLSETPKLPVFF
jgi:catechol 2,3-dioxygenase